MLFVAIEAQMMSSSYSLFILSPYVEAVKSHHGENSSIPTGSTSPPALGTSSARYCRSVRARPPPAESPERTMLR